MHAFMSAGRSLPTTVQDGVTHTIGFETRQVPARTCVSSFIHMLAM